MQKLCFCEPGNSLAHSFEVAYFNLPLYFLEEIELPRFIFRCFRPLHYVVYGCYHHFVATFRCDLLASVVRRYGVSAEEAAVHVLVANSYFFCGDEVFPAWSPIIHCSNLTLCRIDTGEASYSAGSHVIQGVTWDAAFFNYVC